MKRILFVAVVLAFACAFQACAAFYSCGTGGPPVQYRTDQNGEPPGQEK